MGHLVANYHTHNHLCNHAVGSVSDYVKKAVMLNMKEIGISDHNPTPKNFMNEQEYLDTKCFRHMKLEEFYNVYLKEIEEAKELYSSKIKIYSGLECEYIKAQHDYFLKLRNELDYLNLGMHFYVKGKKVHDVYQGITYKSVMDYARACVDGIKSGLFKIIVHPDLFMVNYKNVDGKREFDKHAIKASRLIIEEAIKNNVYLEININGLRFSRNKKSEEWLYPCMDFWKIVSEYKDAKIIFGVDCHDPEFLESSDIDAVKDFANNLSLNVNDFIEFD